MDRGREIAELEVQEEVVEGATLKDLHAKFERVIRKAL